MLLPELFWIIICKMEGEMINNYYNRHYVLCRSDGAIIDAWSDGPNPKKDVKDAICINEKGGYQFRLYPEGDENPPIFDIDDIPLYKWDGKQIVVRTEQEIDQDRKKIPVPPPSPIEQLRADVDFLFAMGGLF